MKLTMFIHDKFIINNSHLIFWGLSYYSVGFMLINVDVCSLLKISTFVSQDLSNSIVVGALEKDLSNLVSMPF